jgi:hypothetical protein
MINNKRTFIRTKKRKTKKRKTKKIKTKKKTYKTKCTKRNKGKNANIYIQKGGTLGSLPDDIFRMVMSNNPTMATNLTINKTFNKNKVINEEIKLQFKNTVNNESTKYINIINENKFFIQDISDFLYSSLDYLYEANNMYDDIELNNALDIINNQIYNNTKSKKTIKGIINNAFTNKIKRRQNKIKKNNDIIKEQIKYNTYTDNNLIKQISFIINNYLNINNYDYLHYLENNDNDNSYFDYSKENVIILYDNHTDGYILNNKPLIIHYNTHTFNVLKYDDNNLHNAVYTDVLNYINIKHNYD